MLAGVQIEKDFSKMTGKKGSKGFLNNIVQMTDEELDQLERDARELRVKKSLPPR
jgi:hypothetical protein